MRDLAALPPARPGAAVAADLHAYLCGRRAAVWTAFCQRQGRVPILEPDPLLAAGSYRIEAGRG